MKVLWFLPLTFVAEVHGFALFAPYLILFFFTTLWLQRRRRATSAAPQPAPRADPAPETDSFTLAAQPAL
jgi:hypothetical protein